MILYEYLYERKGNDSWLKDYVELHRNDIGLYIDHKKRWDGWGGEIKENYTIELDENDLEASQKIVDEWISDNSLHTVFPNGKEEGIKINLKQIIDGE